MNYFIEWSDFELSAPSYISYPFKSVITLYYKTDKVIFFSKIKQNTDII